MQDIQTLSHFATEVKDFIKVSSDFIYEQPSKRQCKIIRFRLPADRIEGRARMLPAARIEDVRTLPAARINESTATEDARAMEKHSTRDSTQNNTRG